MTNIVLFGDSYANGHAPDGSTGHLAAALGVPTYNRLARSGSTAQQWAADQDGMLAAVVCHDARVAVGALGGNDAFAAAADGVVTLEERVQALAALFYVLMRLWSKERVILMVYPDPFFGARPDAAAGHAELARAISAVAGLANYITGGIKLLDLAGVLRPEHFDGQDIHPNPEGYRAIAGAVREMLQEE